MASMSLAREVAAVRRFTRFYTRKLGVLDKKLLGSSLALPEARVVFELATRGPTAPGALAAELEIDAGYMSRLVAALVTRGIASRRDDATDGRAAIVALTAKGKRVFAGLDRASNAQVRALLASVPEPGREALASALATIERVLEPPQPRAIAYRDLEPGELGWVVARHGALYAAEYGWGQRFEALVARIVADFGERRAPGDRAWIAEVDGRAAGSIFCVRDTQTIAKLRLLLVEPWARGLGIGRRLVDDCIAHARRTGYRTMRLWTNSVLASARKIYEAAGFTLVAEQPNADFGPPLVAQTWELRL
jgi:DNA-binding MarR family transcriptional regulator/GNAT superfamily N-acetyltransferase